MEQTGVAIFIDKKGDEKMIPLFSDNPCEEARGLKVNFEDKILANVFYSNSLLNYKVEDLIEDFVRKYGCLPENYVDELVNGFPFIIGRNTNFMYCYK